MRTTNSIPKSRFCNKCGTEKPLDEFYKNKDGLYGRTSKCKACEKKYREENKDQIREKNRRVHERNRDKRLVQMRERSKALYKQNREEKLAANREWRESQKGTWEDFHRHVWKAINCRTVNGRWAKWGHRPTDYYLRKGIKVEFTEDEFREWCQQRRRDIEELHRSAEEYSDHGLLPSVDRIDPTGNYRLDNIELTTVRLNTVRANRTPRRASA